MAARFSRRRTDHEPDRVEVGLAAHPDGTVRPVRYLGDPVLRTPTDPVTAFDEDLAKLIEDMFVSMYAAGGVGLAANQIGVGLSVFVYDCNDDDDNWYIGHLVNPRLERTEGDPTTSGEGCLSVPGLNFDTTRWWHAIAEGVDLHGDPVLAEGTGNFARCLQHETDHLAGHVYLDRLDGDVRKTALREVRATEWAQ